jgi:hypothetical protein
MCSVLLFRIARRFVSFYEAMPIAVNLKFSPVCPLFNCWRSGPNTHHDTVFRKACIFSATEPRFAGGKSFDQMPKAKLYIKSILSFIIHILGGTFWL